MPRLILRLLPLVFILVVPSVFAQRERDTYTNNSLTFEVSGEVRLADSGESATNVQVRLERFSGGLIDQIVTDSRGRFRFPNLQRGYYKVIINAHGFKPVQQDADLQVVFRTFLVIELVADSTKNASGLPPLTDVIDARVPAAARADFDNGRAALKDKNYKDGIAFLEKATLAYSNFFEAQLLLGIAFMDLKEWEKAEKTLQRAVEIKPDNATAMIYLGEVYWRQKRNTDAEQTLREGLKLDQKSWHGHFTLGRLYWDMGEVAKAGGPIGMTLQLKPELAEAHLLAGNILLRVNQRERALVEYREYLRLAPKGEFVGQVQELVRKVEDTLTDKKP
ncbi:MAG TPA: tetratricopeptide repeat protein [Pyrinomonadaceae bacterium]|jgi:thioredoxin-like negative regulator of GroEL|nr:tetratricopeptide repeat protein [Pyrinomonadaceae bacterium]